MFGIRSGRRVGKQRVTSLILVPGNPLWAFLDDWHSRSEQSRLTGVEEASLYGGRRSSSLEYQPPQRPCSSHVGTMQMLTKLLPQITEKEYRNSSHKNAIDPPLTATSNNNTTRSRRCHEVA